MSRGLNKVILIGNLGSDPDVRYGQGNNPVARLSVATTETWNDRESGNQQSRTEWHRVTLFGGLAKVAEQYLKSGSKVYVEGRLQTDKYEQNNETRYSTSVIARELLMLDSAGGAASGGGGQSFGGQGQSQGGGNSGGWNKPDQTAESSFGSGNSGLGPGTGAPQGGKEDFNDDIPF